MQIERVTVPEMTIEQFADKHGLVMEVRERQMDRWQRQHGLRRFFASFKGAEVADGGMLGGAHGDGDSESDAIRDYADRISGERLIIDAMKPTRREIQVPRLVEEPESADAVDPDGGKG